MADYCSNKVDFVGENSDLAIEHFSEMGYGSPPFHDIIIDNNAVYFESRWLPPIKDLQEIAEIFDVDFKLIYQPPHERTKEKYDYTCLRQQKLEGPAALLKQQIEAATSPSDIDKAADAIQDHTNKAQINNFEWTVLVYLAEKKLNELKSPGEELNEDVAQKGRRIGR